MKNRRVRLIVAAGGGSYVGMMQVPECMPRNPAYYLVLFQSPQTQSTLSLRLRGLTAEAVSQRIAESNKQFNGTT